MYVLFCVYLIANKKASFVKQKVMPNPTKKELNVILTKYKKNINGITMVWASFP